MRFKILIFVFILLIEFSNQNVINKLTKEEEDEIIFTKARCSTLSCVHSSALILQKVDFDKEPCDDFYYYACGSYLAEQHTPDEKAEIDTLRIMYEQMIEYLLRIFENPTERTTTKKIHKYAQNFFDNCMATLKYQTDSSLDDLRDLYLQAVGGWPLIERANWDERLFESPEKLILDFRRYINNATENIFNTNKDVNEAKVRQYGLVEDKKEVTVDVLDKQLNKLIGSLVTGMGSVIDNQTRQDIEDLITFEKKIAEYQLKFQRFKKLYTPKSDENIKREMKKINKYMIYLDFLESNLYTQVTKVQDSDVPPNFNEIYVKFINGTSKRTLANSIIWRFTQAALSFMGRDTRNIVLHFKKNTYGSEDNEQRWIYCTELVSNLAPIAAGSIYIDAYFPEEDKFAADELVDYLIRAYNDTIQQSQWMDEKIKKLTLNISNSMHRFIGYHPNLRKEEGDNFYGDLPLYTNDNDFIKTGLTFKMFTTDREYLRALSKKRKNGRLDEDWTKYARPATVNAYYSDKDNSIQFPAGILQIPNFDKNRPPFMNFGGIGSIIGHEITHSFDNLARKIDEWDIESQMRYKERLDCVLSQYSSMRVPDIERYNEITKNDPSPVYLNATFTINEDVADNGGLKLAYRAWRKYEEEHFEGRILPIGIETINNKKMFWLSFAQTYCGVDRPEKKIKKMETDNHSLDQFRVNIPLMNTPEFSEAWGCKLGTVMNPVQKCAVW